MHASLLAKTRHRQSIVLRGPHPSSRVPLGIAGQFWRRIRLEEGRIHEAVSGALFLGEVEILSLRERVFSLFFSLFEFSAIKRKSVMDPKSRTQCRLCPGCAHQDDLKKGVIYRKASIKLD